MATIYNTTDGPIPVDAEGRVVGAHQHRPDVDLGVVSAHIANGNLVDTTAPEPAAAERAVEATDEATPAATPKTTKARQRATEEE
ncbi:MAG: hypothetical protein RR101_15315 [Burkholderiaceae bacterium]